MCSDVLSLPEVSTLLQKENHKLHKFQECKSKVLKWILISSFHYEAIVLVFLVVLKILQVSKNLKIENSDVLMCALCVTAAFSQTLGSTALCVMYAC